jgi:hypothetical protein
MDRRRTISFILGAGLVVAGCGTPGTVAAAEDLLFISAAGRVAVVEPGAAAPTFRGRNATPSSSWSTVVQTFLQGNTTKLVAVDPATGDQQWESVVGDTQRVQIVSADGTLAALSPVDEPPALQGRDHTRIVIAGSGSPEPRAYDLEGNYIPEAFSTDGKSLFVISYVPPLKPTNYQVRRLDLVSGEVTGVYTPDAHLQQSMGGTARIQAASPDGTRLYTLYTLAGDGDSPPRAFVHVLSLDELWAHCIELPEGFETSDESSAAITVSPDGAHAYLADSVSEALVEIDTKELTVSRTGTVDLDPSATHLLATDRTLYAASGTDIVAIDLGSFTEVNAWTMGFADITGLQIGADPNHLFVAIKDHIVVLDVTTGVRVDSIDPEGVQAIDGLGPVMPPPAQEGEKGDITCAC